MRLFGKGDGSKKKWKADYEDTVYKIYDWDNNLAAYFFPQYRSAIKQQQANEDDEEEENDNDEKIIEELNKSHQAVPVSILLLPLVKLDLLDKEGGVDLDYVIGSLDANLGRVSVWKEWLRDNAKTFGITGSKVYTAREDRNMLSIGLRLDTSITLGEKEVIVSLAPLLDKLHSDGLL